MISKAEIEEPYYIDNKKLTKSRFNCLWYEEIFGEKPKVIFDIGAFDLGDSIRLNKYYNCKIYAFEASQERYNICQKNIDTYNIEIYNYVVSDKIGISKFYESFDQLQNESGAQGSLFKHTQKYKIRYNHILQTEGTIVQSITIKEFCTKFNLNIDLVHIDVEGSEYKVIKGFQDLRPKMVYLETLSPDYWEGVPNLQELHDQMIDMNYSLILDIETDRLYVHRFGR